MSRKKLRSRKGGTWYDRVMVRRMQRFARDAGMVFKQSELDGSDYEVVHRKEGGHKYDRPPPKNQKPKTKRPNRARKR